MEEGKRSKEYNQGYEDAKKDIVDDKKLKLFAEGYKAGYRDGYQAAKEDLKKMMMSKMPPEIQQQMGEGGAQPMWLWPW